MAENDENSYNLAIEIFKRKYAEKTIHVSQLNDLKENGSNDDVVDERYLVRIINFKFLLKVLNYFGQFITNFSIDFDDIPTINSNQITKSLRDNCVESLNSLLFYDCKGTELDNIDVPFKNIQTFAIGGGPFKTMNGKILKFTEIFPQVQTLTFDNFFELDDHQSVIQKYPNLKHFQVSVGNGEYLKTFLTHADVEHILQLNPTIQNLSLGQIKESFLKNVTEILPNISNLEIVNLANDDSIIINQIIFDNVRSLKIFTMEESSIQNTKFKNLDELTLELLPDVMSNWEPFMYKHPEITKLNILNSFEYDKILKYGVHLPKLIITSIRCNSELEIKTIVQFLKQSNELKTLILNFFKEDNIESLRRQVDIEWEIVFIDNIWTDKGIEVHRRN